MLFDEIYKIACVEYGGMSDAVSKTEDTVF